MSCSSVIMGIIMGDTALSNVSYRIVTGGQL
jgi:hypothetical protein